MQRAKTRRLSARRKEEIKKNNEELPSFIDETDDSMLDNSKEMEDNQWLRQATSAKVVPNKKQSMAKLNLDFELLDKEGSDTSALITEETPAGTNPILAFMRK